MNAGAGKHLSTEAANAAQNLLDAVNAPTKALLGHPLTGAGATGARGGTGGAAVTGGGTPANATGNAQSVSIPVLNTNTPLGPVQLTLNGTVDFTTGAIVLTSGTLVVPSEVSLGADAIGPLLTTATALHNSSTAINTL